MVIFIIFYYFILKEVTMRHRSFHMGLVYMLRRFHIPM